MSLRSHDPHTRSLESTTSYLRHQDNREVLEILPRPIRPCHSALITQLGNAWPAGSCRSTYTAVNHDENENKVPGRGWSFMKEIEDTQCDYAMVLRQMKAREVLYQVLNRLDTISNVSTIDTSYSKSSRGSTDRPL
jgi:hypothetical protein